MSSGVLLLAFVLFSVFGWREIIIGRAVYSHLLFVLYAVFVNVSWFFVLSNDVFLLYAAYLIVAGIMYFCSVMAGRSMSSRDAKLLIGLLFASVAVQLAIVVSGVGREGIGADEETLVRQVAFFNNPNQLAYYVAACSGLVLLLAHLYKVNSTLVLMTCFLALVVSSFTTSRAGVAACLIYVLLAIFGSSALKIVGKSIAVVVLVVGVLSSYERFINTAAFEALDNRVDAIGEVDETADQRGYDRILIYTDDLVWGVGEGAFERFDADIELHSYFGTLLFSYGVIGVILFLWFLRSAVPDWRSLTFLVPLFVYNLTHNGGRSLMLWAMFGLMAAATLPAIGQGYSNHARKSRRRRSRKRRA